MTLSETNKRNLAILRDIYDVSGLCSTRTYVWAGLVQDILAGKFLREHRSPRAPESAQRQTGGDPTRSYYASI